MLEASVRRAVAAWADAVDGARRDLLDVATPAAAQALLHPGDPDGRTRRVIRGPRVRHLAIAALDTATTALTITVEVEVTGRRYTQVRATGVVVRGVDWLAVTMAERCVSLSSTRKRHALHLFLGDDHEAIRALASVRVAARWALTLDAIHS